MAVIIENFEMPQSCYNCQFCLRRRTSDCGYFGMCDLTDGLNLYEQNRSEDCPLKEVPDNNSVLEDIKADIKNKGYKELDNDIVVSAIVSVDDVIDIIDRHISGKENTDG